MIKYILLDFGNVLAFPTTGSWHITPKFLEVVDINKIDEGKLKAAMTKYSVILDEKVINLQEEYEMFKKFYYNVLNECQYVGNNWELARNIAYNRTYEFDKYKPYDNIKQELFQLAKKYILILLSDNWPCVIDVMKQYEIYDFFDKLYISSMYGQLKRDGIFFDNPINDYHIANGEALFIDDNEDLLDIAVAKGFKVCLMDRDNRVEKAKYNIIHDLNSIDTYCQCSFDSDSIEVKAKQNNEWMDIIKDKSFNAVSSTAIITSYPRIYTDIPYDKEIYNWLKRNCQEDFCLNKNLAPEIEARYKLINKLLDKTKCKQILELAAGYSSRGIIYANRGYKYIEMDLKSVINNKQRILSELRVINDNLNVVYGNAICEDDYKCCDDYFSLSESVAVVNEGLLRYLTFAEKRLVAENVYNVLKKYGGVWITCDVTPKKFIESQNKALPKLNNNLSSITFRNNILDRFNDLSHVKSFFGEIGFDVVEVHKFSEVKDELYSINKYNIVDEKILKTLEDAIVVLMKIKK